MSETFIRSALEADLDSINRIYNHYVETSTCTWQESLISTPERLEWWQERVGRFPILVAEICATVAGFAACGPFRPRSGYRFTVETSVYLQPEFCGRGVGRSLMLRLLDDARTAGFHTAIAGVSADQVASMRLHLSLGFVEVARMRETGFKFGRWLDHVYFQKML